MKTLFIISITFLLLNSCNYTKIEDHHGSDTLIIKTNAAIFYYPDSNALEQLRSEVDKETFDSAVSDYTHFMGNASVYMDLTKLKKIIFKGPKVLKFICQDKKRAHYQHKRTC